MLNTLTRRGYIPNDSQWDHGRMQLTTVLIVLAIIALLLFILRGRF